MSVLTAEQIAEYRRIEEPTLNAWNDLLDTIAYLQQRLDFKQSELDARNVTLGQLHKSNDELKQRLAESERRTIIVLGEMKGALDIAESQLAELREPMACGHPKACLANHDPEECPCESECACCTACARENERIAQARLEEFDWWVAHEPSRHPVREHGEGCDCNIHKHRAELEKAAKGDL